MSSYNIAPTQLETDAPNSAKVRENLISGGDGFV
jgi:hypothetical protein